MAQVFRRKKFSSYLGEQRAIDDIVMLFTVDVYPTPTPTPSITPSNTPTPSITPTGTPLITSTPTQTSTPTTTLTASPTPDPTNTSTPTQTSTPTPDPTTTPTQTPSPTTTLTASPTPDPTSTPTQTPSPTTTLTASPTPDPTSTPTQTPSPTTTLTASPTPDPTQTPTQTSTPTTTITASPTPNPTTTPTQTPSPTKAQVVQYVAGAYGYSLNNTLGYSYDGLVWSGSSSGKLVLSGAAYDVASDGTKWVATGYQIAPSPTFYGTPFAYSTDGINWTAGNTPPNRIFGYYGWAVRTNGSIWVAGGQSNFSSTASTGTTLAYSVDGINWSAGTLNLGGRIVPSVVYGVGWNGSMWLAAANCTGSTLSAQTKVLYSYDGMNWTGQTNTLFNGVNYSPVWNGTMWLMLGTSSNGRVAYSYDGFNWSASTNGNSIFTSYAYRGVWFNDRFVAVGVGTGAGSTIGYSFDGLNWSASTNANTFLNTGQGIAINGSNQLIAGGRSFTGATGSRIIISNDGNTWSATTNPNDVFTNISGVYGIAYKNPIVPPTPTPTPNPTQTPTQTSTPTNTPTNTPTPTATLDNVNKLQAENSDFIHTENNDQIITEQ